MINNLVKLIYCLSAGYIRIQNTRRVDFIATRAKQEAEVQLLPATKVRRSSFVRRNQAKPQQIHICL